MKKLLIAILSIAMQSLVHAQFNGGEGDGFTMSATIQNNLNGVVDGVNALYQGGAGDGFDRNFLATYLDGTNTALLYKGGIGDGFSVEQASYAVNGTDLSYLYEGGNGEGSNSQSGSFSVSGVSLAQLYRGGSGDGFDVLIYNGSLNDVSASVFYSGGEGDGFTVTSLQAYISGTSSSAIYSGGAGDGFSNSTFYGTLAPLPVQLISFDAEAKLTYVLVKWITASETDVAYYTIERSQNGALFSDLLTVPSQGNSTALRQYTAEDTNPFEGLSYYRLKWTDEDSKEEYSEIRSVVFDSHDKRDFLLFPNPNDGQILHIQLTGYAPKENLYVTIATIQGAIIYQSNQLVPANGGLTIDLQDKLAKGSYVVQLTRKGEAVSKIMIVQ